MSLILVALIVSAQTAAADVQQPVAAPAQAVAAVPEKPKKPKLICKRTDDADSGSHMARRTCRTAEEWNGGQAGTSRSGVSISGEAMQGH